MFIFGVRRTSSPSTKVGTDVLSGDNVLPGWSVNTSDLFGKLDEECTQPYMKP